MKRIFAISALSLLGLWRGSPGQQSKLVPTKGQAALQHEVTVALKLVQVYVTDKKGNPVSDLRRDDFALHDNKDEITITEFERHALSLPGTADPSVDREPVKTLPAPLLNRRFFFLFDLVFTEGKGFRIARDAALRYINTGLLPTDEASVLSFSGGRSLDVRIPLTQDHHAVRKSVESLTMADLLDRFFPERDDEPVRIVSSESASTSDFRPSSGGGPSETRILAGNFIWALKSFAQALRYEPGQKHIIFYSKGIRPTTIGRGPAGGTYSELSQGYANMCKELAAAGVSVFPVNTQDPDTTMGKGEATLRETAAATGGRFLGFAVNAEKHMETVNDITGMFYVLGYPISQTWDGKFHTVRIKVTRPDCEVHAQPGYFNPKPFAEYSKLEKEIHLVDLALSAKPLSQDPTRFAMQAIPIACSPKGNLLFITEIPRGLGGIEGPRVEVSSLVFNALDEIVDSQRVQMDLKAGSSDQDHSYILTTLSARPGTYRCRVILRDPETGKAAVAGVSAMVPESTEDRLILFPPLLALENATNQLLSGNDENGGQAVDPQAGQAFLLNPKEYAPYLGNELTAGTSIGAVLRCSSPNDDVSGFELSAHLENQTSGKAQDVRLLILGKKSEMAIKAFLAKLDIPQTAPGSYNLVFSINDTQSGLSSQVTRSFLVR